MSIADEERHHQKLLDDLSSKSADQLTLVDVVNFLKIINYNFANLQEALEVLGAELTSLRKSVNAMITAHDFIDDATSSRKPK